MSLAGPVLVLGAPAAGSRSRGVADAVEAAVRATGASVVRVSGSTADEVVADARSLATAQGPVRPSALVAVGGDGTVQLAATALARTGVPLHVVPAGSGNDAARALGVRARNPAEAAAHLHHLLTTGALAREIDVLHVAGGGPGGADAPARDVVTVVAAGFDAAVTARANAWAQRPADGQRPSLGHRLPPRARYTAAVLALLPAWRPRRYRLVLDGVVHDVDAVLVAVANTTSYGGGMRIAPRARPDDGLADVVVVGALSRPGLLALLPAVFLGWHTAVPAVRVHRAAHVSVSLIGGDDTDGGSDAHHGPDPRRPLRPGVLAHGDGEPLHAPPLDVRVLPGALRLLT